MDITTITVALTSAAAIAGGATACITAIRGLRAAVRPLSARAGLQWAVFHGGTHEAEAISFITSAKAAGYRAPARIVMGQAAGAAAAGVVGAKAVVLWRPTQEHVDVLLPILREAAPDAVVMVYTTERLAVQLGERLLLANSALRLRGDLGVVAEA